MQWRPAVCFDAGRGRRSWHVPSVVEWGRETIETQTGSSGSFCRHDQTGVTYRCLDSQSTRILSRVPCCWYWPLATSPILQLINPW